MSGPRLGLSGRMWLMTTLAGTAVGIVYVLSPLTVWFAAAAIAIVRWAERGHPREERQWVRVLLIAAIVLRVMAVFGLFAMTDHAKVPFATFFGDEEFFIRRSIWLRNMALGIPIHGADLIYTFDEVGATSYLYLLALIQILVGPSPYGVHLVAISFYLAAAVLLYRLVRSTLGRMPALAGFGILLYLPSLFAWSISALKEPCFFLLTALGIVLVVKLIRGVRWRERAAALAAVVAVVVAVETLRRAGAVLSAASLLAGLVIAWLIVRPRLVVAALVALPIVSGAILSRPEVQVRAINAVGRAAWQHVGHIMTPGYVFKTLDDRFYINTADIDDMRFFEAARFGVRSLVKYVTVPLPWEVQSRSALAYLPEQVVWYGLIALLPAGLLFSFRRDVLVTSLLIAHAVVAALVVAPTSGNVGTLVRHRGMAIPYIAWLGCVAACELASRAAEAQARRSSAMAASIHVPGRIEPTCP